MQRENSRDLLGGWPLATWLCLCVVATCVAGVALSSGTVDGVRLVIRLTARTSLILFLLAFTASSLEAPLGGAGTRWLRANRRYFGLAFAFSHGVHGAAIIALSRLDPVVFDQLTTPVSFIAGGIGYAVILAMTLTSFNWTAALVGARAWRGIHTGGGWLLAIFFAINFGRRAVMMPAMYWPYMLLILAAIGLRIAARGRRGRTATRRL